ncbi:MAG: NIL domain-containing protein [bacterium]
MISKKIVLHFPQIQVDKPITYGLVKNYNLMFNILKARIDPEMSPDEEGLLVIELTGEESDYERGIKYLADLGIKIQPLSQDITRDEKACTHCGACVSWCPTEALVVERPSMRVLFDDSLCIACEACLKVCPTRAMKVFF